MSSSNKAHQCPHCTSKFTRPEGVLEHIKRKHPIQRSGTRSESGPIGPIQEIAPYSNQELADHTVTMHDDQSDDGLHSIKTYSEVTFGSALQESVANMPCLSSSNISDDGLQSIKPYSEVTFGTAPPESVAKMPRLSSRANSFQKDSQKHVVVNMAQSDESDGPTDEPYDDEHELEKIAFNRFSRNAITQNGRLDWRIVNQEHQKVVLPSGRYTQTNSNYDVDGVWFPIRASDAAKLFHSIGNATIERSSKQISQRDSFKIMQYTRPVNVKDITHTHIMKYENWIGCFEVYILHPDETREEIIRKIEKKLLKVLGKAKHPTATPLSPYGHGERNVFALDIIDKLFEKLGDRVLYFTIYDSKKRMENRGYTYEQLPDVFSKLDQFYNNKPIDIFEDWGTRISAIGNPKNKTDRVKINEAFQNPKLDTESDTESESESDDDDDEEPVLICPTKEYIENFTTGKQLKKLSLFPKVSIPVYGFTAKPYDLNGISKLKAYVEGFEDAFTHGDRKLLQTTEPQWAESLYNDALFSFSTLDGPEADRAKKHIEAIRNSKPNEDMQKDLDMVCKKLCEKANRPLRYRVEVTVRASHRRSGIELLREFCQGVTEPSNNIIEETNTILNWTLALIKSLYDEIRNVIIYRENGELDLERMMFGLVCVHLLKYAALDGLAFQSFLSSLLLGKHLNLNRNLNVYGVMNYVVWGYDLLFDFEDKIFTMTRAACWELRTAVFAISPQKCNQLSVALWLRMAINDPRRLPIFQKHATNIHLKKIARILVDLYIATLCDYLHSRLDKRVRYYNSTSHTHPPARNSLPFEPSYSFFEQHVKPCRFSTIEGWPDYLRDSPRMNSVSMQELVDAIVDPAGPSTYTKICKMPLKNEDPSKPLIDRFKPLDHGDILAITVTYLSRNLRNDMNDVKQAVFECIQADRSIQIVSNVKKETLFYSGHMQDDFKRLDRESFWRTPEIKVPSKKHQPSWNPGEKPIAGSISPENVKDFQKLKPVEGLARGHRSMFEKLLIVRYIVWCEANNQKIDWTEYFTSTNFGNIRCNEYTGQFRKRDHINTEGIGMGWIQVLRAGIETHRTFMTKFRDSDEIQLLRNLAETKELEIQEHIQSFVYGRIDNYNHIKL